MKWYLDVLPYEFAAATSATPTMAPAGMSAGTGIILAAATGRKTAGAGWVQPPYSALTHISQETELYHAGRTQRNKCILLRQATTQHHDHVHVRALYEKDCPEHAAHLRRAIIAGKFAADARTSRIESRRPLLEILVGTMLRTACCIACRALRVPTPCKSAGLVTFDKSAAMQALAASAGRFTSYDLLH